MVAFDKRKCKKQIACQQIGGGQAEDKIQSDGVASSAPEAGLRAGAAPPVTAPSPAAMASEMRIRERF